MNKWLHWAVIFMSKSSAAVHFPREAALWTAEGGWSKWPIIVSDLTGAQKG